MLAAFSVWFIFGSAGGLAQVAPPPSDNSYNDDLRKLPPEEQAAKLAEHLGLWCIGTKPFFMGETKGGKAKGYAYWSVTCAGSGSYMVQITPDGQGAALDCRVLKAQGQGRECYKTF
jgi:hypothetical protein